VGGALSNYTRKCLDRLIDPRHIGLTPEVVPAFFAALQNLPIRSKPSTSTPLVYDAGTRRVDRSDLSLVVGSTTSVSVDEHLGEQSGN
jgi:hypothetical protein